MLLIFYVLPRSTTSLLSTKVTIEFSPASLLFTFVNEFLNKGVHFWLSWDVDLGLSEEEEDEDAEVEDGKRVNQIKVPALIPTPVIAPLALASVIKPILVPSSGGEEDMAPRARALGKNRATKEKPMKLALDLILALPIPTEARVDLAASEQATVNARNEAKTAIEEKNKALQYMAELQKTPSDHLACITVAPLAKLPDSSKVYSLILLSGFNEEDYANQPVEDDVAHDKELREGKGENARDLERGVSDGNLTIPLAK
ncbi:hypothetical protein Acr_28g0007070 [Actinidia rufa]|uniref:Uncharacterized protein n=1 Tax=Actinidia rufa TaxID=165716 RepID=A0A7J0HA54_9ERIC|nr:hypothetical protein Acr_28g0007070 [Actinidia rufa]